MSEGVLHPISTHLNWPVDDQTGDPDGAGLADPPEDLTHACHCFVITALLRHVLFRRDLANALGSPAAAIDPATRPLREHAVCPCECARLARATPNATQATARRQALQLLPRNNEPSYTLLWTRHNEAPRHGQADTLSPLSVSV